MSDDAWLTEDVIAAVARHMNTDHAEDNVVICRGLGGCDGVTSAEFVSMTTTAAVFVAKLADGERRIEIPFEQPVTARPEVRTRVAELYHCSAALLGLPPRR